jgi:hypothetical protein
VSIRLEEIVDTYLGAEGDVRKCGTGLKWLHADMLTQLYESSLERDTDSARTCIAVFGPPGVHFRRRTPGSGDRGGLLR